MAPREYGIRLKRDYTAFSIGSYKPNNTDAMSPVQYPDIKRYTSWRIHNGKIILKADTIPGMNQEMVPESDTVSIALLRRDSLVLRFADLTDTGRGYLRTMLLINSYYVMGAAVNTTLIAGVFRAGGDSRFGFICDTIDMWCYAVPLGFLAAAVLKLPPMWVYFLLCTDEFVKWPWVIRHYLSRKWLRNITREGLFEDEAIGNRETRQ